MENKIVFGIFFVLCAAWQVHGAVNCNTTGAGRFADPSDTTCQNYTLCVYNSTTAAYLSYNYVCPTTSLFNPSSSLCTTNYTCNSTSTTNTTTTISTTLCVSAGRYANITDTSCKTYYLCVLATNGTYLEYGYTCPTTSVFSPTAKLCTTSYTCTTT